jgi:hypothetical protein
LYSKSSSVSLYIFIFFALPRICKALHIKGKIERFFRFVDTSFKPEAYQQIEQGRISTLEELNQRFTAWLDGYYHERRHGATKQTPKARLAACSRPIRRKTLAELTEIFLWEENRKVDKTGCVHLMGNVYEVDLELCGQTALLRYDPFDLSRIQVWHDGKRFSDAAVIDLTIKYDHRVKPTGAEAASVADDQLAFSFLELAEQKRQAAWKKDPVSFRCPERGETK